MVSGNNPAGRLYAILSEARKKGDHIATKDMWAGIFGIDPNNEFLLLQYLVSLQQIVHETRQLIESRDDLNKALYVRAFPTIEKAVAASNLNASWNTFKSSITDDAMARLEFCAELLSSDFDEVKLTDQELEELANEVSILTEWLHKSGIDITLKRIILEQLENIRMAISQYRIRGSKGLKEVMEGIIGSLIANREIFKAEGNKDVLERFGKIFDKLDSLTSKALKIKKVISNTVSLFGLYGQVDG